ncbi:NAD-dependent epimerase/dehydratase family protein [Aurantiacibacter poecillastricola]|uniref:NAD-dependent epimerase/dehydratase family protein n=1 Tax=Aurantiacibacter poecillastricola TaxID=3064385 RepID=UPI00273E525B|nr:NAD-dependent epimerase/dehydratase family protein [Aurantiacibacter sp. 219JJ12-13]MDP5262579.1 NAD-dependent epimerase/dehydratase family protein [Aurantiacibacter sp. 219JJ12-13]
MSERLRVLLVGATGLIGRTIIARSPELPHVILQGLARREIAFPPGTRMELVLAERGEWPGIIEQLAPDAVICALGTTHRKAGSQEGVREVDHDLVLEVAQAAKKAEVRNFVQISSVGADAFSRNSYLKVKGETERDLRALRLKRLDIMRPGLLRGRRQNDLRPVEMAGQVLAPLADMLLVGGRTKYRSIRAYDVASAALGFATAKAAGQFIHEHDAIMRMAREFERGLAAKAEADVG